MFGKVTIRHRFAVVRHVDERECLVLMKRLWDLLHERVGVEWHRRWFQNRCITRFRGKECGLSEIVARRDTLHRGSHLFVE